MDNAAGLGRKIHGGTQVLSRVTSNLSHFTGGRVTGKPSTSNRLVNRGYWPLLVAGLLVTFYLYARLLVTFQPVIVWLLVVRVVCQFTGNFLLVDRLVRQLTSLYWWPGYWWPGYWSSFYVAGLLVVQTTIRASWSARL